jgi:caa(3)-type oxidase subunit IV
MSADSHAHDEKYYIKIWAWLLILLVISVLGPEIGNKWVTLVTAFGIAIVKALMVAKYFMHLNVEKKIIHYVLYTMLILCGVFWGGTVVDVNKNEGRNWVNKASIDHIANPGRFGADHDTHK